MVVPGPDRPLGRRYPRLTYEIVIADPKTLRDRDCTAATSKCDHADPGLRSRRKSGDENPLQGPLMGRGRAAEPVAKRRKIVLAD